MITEIVTFAIPKNMNRDEVERLYRQSAPAWAANQKLVRKYYLYDAAASAGGGVYLWPDAAAARAAHGDAFRQRIRDTFGSEPEIRVLETPVIVDNVDGTIA